MSFTQKQTKYENGLKQTLRKYGLRKPSKIADTLQGSIWKASVANSNKCIIAKVTDKALHSQSMVIIRGVKYKVQENIITETGIQKHLTCGPESKQCPNSVVKYIDSFQNESHYFLLMEYGGMSLFDFIVKIHHYTNQGNIDISELHKVIKVIFKQMIECIEYIHSRNVCHFDISLENFLINDVDVNIIDNELKFECDTIQVKLCDFGLAELFADNGTFCSSKWCGKPGYSSPEISNGQRFNAKSNDVFCLGVCLWIMITGIPPFVRSNKRSESFNYIMNGDIVALLLAWKRYRYVNKELLSVFSSVFKYEEHRCGLLALKKSGWFKN